VFECQPETCLNKLQIIINLELLDYYYYYPFNIIFMPMYMLRCANAPHKFNVGSSVLMNASYIYFLKIYFIYLFILQFLKASKVSKMHFSFS
jgi:hypothetical protein